LGVGFWVKDDHAGLIRATRFVGTYAYHVKLNDSGSHLSFGGSAGVNDSKINTYQRRI